MAAGGLTRPRLVPPPPFFLTNFTINVAASGGLSELRKALEGALAAARIDYEYCAAKWKAKCYVYKPRGNCAFVLRTYTAGGGGGGSNPNNSGNSGNSGNNPTYLVELQRRKGCHATFRRAYDRVVVQLAAQGVLPDDCPAACRAKALGLLPQRKGKGTHQRGKGGSNSAGSANVSISDAATGLQRSNSAPASGLGNQNDGDGGGGGCGSDSDGGPGWSDDEDFREEAARRRSTGTAGTGSTEAAAGGGGGGVDDVSSSDAMPPPPPFLRPGRQMHMTAPEVAAAAAAGTGGASGSSLGTGSSSSSSSSAAPSSAPFSTTGTPPLDDAVAVVEAMTTLAGLVMSEYDDACGPAAQSIAALTTSRRARAAIGARAVAAAAVACAQPYSYDVIAAVGAGAPAVAGRGGAGGATAASSAGSVTPPATTAASAGTPFRQTSAPAQLQSQSGAAPSTSTSSSGAPLSAVDAGVLRLLWSLLERAAPPSPGGGHCPPYVLTAFECRTACALALVNLAKEPSCAAVLAGPLFNAGPRLLDVARCVPICAVGAALRRECLHAVYRLMTSLAPGSPELTSLVSDCYARSQALNAPPFTDVDEQYDGWAGLLAEEVQKHASSSSATPSLPSPLHHQLSQSSLAGGAGGIVSTLVSPASVSTAGGAWAAAAGAVVTTGQQQQQAPARTSSR